MRTLKFIVDGQIIKPDPNCDFSGLVPGTNGYLRAEFSFTPEWSAYVKIATFWSGLGTSYPSCLLDANNSCLIPEEALKRRTFKIKIEGRRRIGEQVASLTTNKVAVCQNGGKA